MPCVLVFGAGASHGENLKALEGGKENSLNRASPPLVDGFFSKDLFLATSYLPKDAERDFQPAFGYIRQITGIDEALGQGRWNNLNIEDIFTSVELDREFRSQESDAGARLLLVRNSLIRYIWRIIGLCTCDKYGQYSRLLTTSLGPEDSLITFNWDLLVDQELHPDKAPRRESNPLWHYSNFLGLVVADRPTVKGGNGLFLKMHGSLNWFQCTNPKCPSNSEIEFDRHTQGCLDRAMGMLWGDMDCRRCGSETIPLLIPPLLRKPITDNWVIRSIWGLARKKLETATAVGIVGFSAAPTDFYASWLLRSTVGLRTDAKVFVVNPDNNPASPGHHQFKQRMEKVFPNGYNGAFLTCSQTDAVLAQMRVEF